MKNFLRNISPTFLIEWYRTSKKKIVDSNLQKEKRKGVIYTKKDMTRQFRKVGIKPGDVILVHSSLSKIGYVENGAKDVVEALLEVIGENGHVLMPNSPNSTYQLDYIRELDFFDMEHSESKLGAISEYFRLLPESIRSAHPTEPVSCVGPDSEFFVGHHFGNITPYNENSPFFKVSERNGKILYIGVTLDNAGTNLHTLEDSVENFKFPVYHTEEFDIMVRFENRTLRTMKTRVHDPEQSKKRKCDDLIPLFEEKGVLKKVRIGKAASLLVDAKGMLEVMQDEYYKNGVTMYTPKGS